MLIGYARVSKADGSQSLDLQHDALRAAGVERDNIYDDLASCHFQKVTARNIKSRLHSLF
ncbi:recombinase family protein [Morganella morganii]